MSENNDYIQLPPLKKDTPSDVVAFMWEYMKVPENSREKVKNLLKDANENGVKLSHQAPTLYDVVPKEEIAEFEELMRKTIAEDRKSTRLNSSHRSLSRMPSSA